MSAARTYASAARPRRRARRLVSWPFLALLAASSLGPACTACQDSDQAQPTHDGSRSRRRFRPPPDQVRPVPPHAIHASGVGPYELGMDLGKILNLLPHGPRVVLTQIDGVVYCNLVRVDGNALVIGVTRPLGVTFVSVLDERIARTQDGVGVGASLARLRERMGPPLQHPSLAMDPRMIGFSRLPGARFVLDGREEAASRVVAVNIRRADAELLGRVASPEAAPAPPATDGPRDQPGERVPSRSRPADVPPASQPADADGRRLSPCVASGAPAGPDSRDGDEQRFLAAAQAAAGALEDARVTRGCLTGQGVALVANRSQLALIGGEGDKLRKLAEYSRDGVVFAAPLDVDDDGMSEIAVVYQSEHASERERERIWSLEILRYEAGRLQALAQTELYRLSTSSAAWVGASLDEIELLLELVADGRERVHITGLFVQGNADRPSNAVQLLPVELPIRPRRTRPEAAGASPVDGGVADASSSRDARRAAPPEAGAAGNEAGAEDRAASEDSATGRGQPAPASP